MYQVYPRSFADDDEDGTGDVAGMIDKLPYLAGLGVDAVWVSPWYRSPLADGGYDVADYRDIHPDFGTLAEADEFVAAAHELGLRVLIDLVPNHCSDTHPWFEAALAAAAGFARARAVHLPRRLGAGRRAPAEQLAGDVRRRRLGAHDRRRRHAGPVVPPPVRARTTGLELGEPGGRRRVRLDPAVLVRPRDRRLPHRRGQLDGQGTGSARPRGRRDRRADAEHPDRYAVHEPAARARHPPTLAEGLRLVRRHRAGARVFVSEAWVTPAAELAKYVRPEELHTTFNFDALMCEWTAESQRNVIDLTLGATGAVGAPATWVLANHDTTRVVTRYGRRGDRCPLHPRRDRQASYLRASGCRCRGATDVDLGRQRARAAVLLELALPGGAYVYQGDELGLEEVEDLPEELLQDPTWERSGHTVRGRDGCRVPIPWSGDQPPFGFGSTKTAPWLPQPSHWAGLTVQAQDSDPGSMLTLYRAALAERRRNPALGDGKIAWDEGPPAEVLSFVREPGFRCVVNFGADPYLLPDGEVLVSSVSLDGRQLGTDEAVWLRSTIVHASITARSRTA